MQAMTRAQKIMKTAETLGFPITFLSPEEIRTIQQQMAERFSYLDDPFVWRERPDFETASVADVSRWLGDFLTQAEPAILMLGCYPKGNPYDPVVRFEDATQLALLIEQGYGSIITIVNETFDYVLHQDDHDVFHAMGTAGAWLTARLHRIYELLGVLPNPKDFAILDRPVDEQAAQQVFHCTYDIEDDALPFNLIFTGCRDIRSRPQRFPTKEVKHFYLGHFHGQPYMSTRSARFDMSFVYSDLTIEKDW